MCAARAGANVTAVDINPEAVRCTAANAAANGLNVDARLSDLFAAIGNERFDLIAWNPPFLPGIPNTPAERAFYGGSDFDVIRRFAKEARGHLNTNGVIYTIVSADIDISRIEQIFRDHNFNVSWSQSSRWGLGETMVILCAR